MITLPTPQTLTMTAVDSASPAITGNITLTISPAPPGPGGGAALVSPVPQSGAAAVNLTVMASANTPDGVWSDGPTYPASVAFSKFSEQPDWSDLVADPAAEEALHGPSNRLFAAFAPDLLTTPR
jgi:hypothetical protein